MNLCWWCENEKYNKRNNKRSERGWWDDEMMKWNEEMMKWRNEEMMKWWNDEMKWCWQVDTFLPRPFFFLVISSISSKRMTCISDGRPVSRRVRGPSRTIWRRGETINRSHGCLANGILRNSGTTVLGSISRTEGQTRLRWISSSLSKFLSHFILSSSSPSKLNKTPFSAFLTRLDSIHLFISSWNWTIDGNWREWNSFLLTCSIKDLLKLVSSLSRILRTISFSWESSVRDSISRSRSGTFMMCWTGATSKSVSCSFLHLGSLLHHCIAQSTCQRNQHGFNFTTVDGRINATFFFHLLSISKHNWMSCPFNFRKMARHIDDHVDDDNNINNNKAITGLVDWAE